VTYLKRKSNMKVQITDSFTKSLKRLIWHQHWLYRTYATFRYDIPLFVKNVWRFRRELWDHQWWDYRYTLNMMERSLIIMEKGMGTKGMEVSETREPKVKSMRRALELLRNNREDNFVERAEAELGPITRWDWELDEEGVMIDRDTPEQKEHNRNVFKRAREIEDSEWKELWEIFKGTKNSKKYGKNYDGTDMRAWWD
jgi:hypothetical protein